MACVAATGQVRRAAAGESTGHRRGPARSPRLVAASVGLASLAWVIWAATGHRGIASPLGNSVILAANVVVTKAVPGLKLRGVRVIQRYVLNPAVRVLLIGGVLPLGISLLETTGRRSGRPRRSPVGEGRQGDTFWIVAEHGRRANYVRNIVADPRVRVKVRHGVRSRWRDGVAHVLADDDPYERQRRLCRWHPLRALNAATVRVMGTDLVTIRIDLSPTSS